MNPSRPAPWPSRPTVIVLGGWAVFLAMLSIFWFGPRGSDDTLYWHAANNWLRRAPYIGPEHWDLRHTIVLPLVLARLVLGDGPLALAMPSIAAGLAVIALAGAWVREAAGAAAAWIAVVLIATGPLLVLLSSTADIDFIEIAFILASLFLLYRSMTRGPSPGELVFSGIAMGLALVSRETAVFAVMAVGLLFLAGFGMKRHWYVLFGAGLAAVVLGEMLAYWHLTGDPLYRLTISIHHDSTIDRWVEKGGGLPVIHPLVDPIIMLVASHDFGAGFVLGLLIVGAYLATHRPPSSQRVLFILLGCVAITWTVVAAALWAKLALVSRYYAMPLICLTMLTAVCLGHMLQAGRHAIAAVLAVLLVGGNVLACALDNRNFMFGETMLVAVAGQQNQMIHTDEQTLRRAELLVRWAHVLDRVTDRPPVSGELFLFNPPRAASASVSPSAGWVVVERVEPAPSLLQRLLIPLRRVLPSWIARKVGPGHPGVTLYRVP